MTPGPPVHADLGARIAEPIGAAQREILQRTVDRSASRRHLDVLLVLLLMTFGFGVRQWHIGLPETRYFDEIYYAKSGQELLNGKRDSNTVHPPLAKQMIAAFGYLYSAVGTPLQEAGLVGGVTDYARWRVGSLVMGVLMIPLTYALGFRLFRSRWVAFVGAFLLDIDFLHVTQSRITMLDMYVAFFILAGTYAAWRYIEAERKTSGWAVLSVLSFAVGVACKWNALFAAVGAVPAMLWLKPYALRVSTPFPLRGAVRRPMWQWLLTLCVMYAVIVPFVYAVSFIPFLWQHQWKLGQSWKELKANHMEMWTFRHDPKQFTHRYMSDFWKWPTMMRPVWYHYEEHDQPDGSLIPPRADRWIWWLAWRGQEPDHYVTGILAMGSPFVWWFFLIFLLLTVIQSIILPLTVVLRCIGFKAPDEAPQPALAGHVVAPPPSAPSPWRQALDAWRFGPERPWLFLMLLYFPQVLLWGVNHGFLFYMLPCVPLMSIFTAAILREWLDLPFGKFCAGLYLATAVVFFMAYYPLLVGWSIPRPLYELLIFTEKWI